jgi:hypothetical protein
VKEKHVEFEDRMAVTVFWIVTPYNSDRAQRFGEICRVHLRSRRVKSPEAVFSLVLFFNSEHEGYMFLQNQQNPPAPSTVFCPVFLFDPQFEGCMFLRNVRFSELCSVATRYTVLLKNRTEQEGIYSG